jgi:hypothetical protein
MKTRRWALALLVMGATLVAGAPARAEAPGGVSFAVTDFRGGPAPQAFLSGRISSSSGPYAFLLETDASGHASTEGVPPGTYDMTVEPNRFLTDSVGPYTQLVTVVSGQTTEVDVHLPASDWVSGRVTDRITHKGLSGVRVNARSHCDYDGDLCDALHNYTDANGYYTIHSLIADPNWPSTTYRVLLGSGDVGTPWPRATRSRRRPASATSGSTSRGSPRTATCPASDPPVGARCT